MAYTRKKKQKQEKKAVNPFLKALHYIFIKDIGFKLLAIVVSAAIYLVTVGLA